MAARASRSRRGSTSRRAFLRAAGATAAVGGIGVAGAAEAVAQTDADAPTEGGSGEGPSPPSNLAVDGIAPTLLELTWDASQADDLDHYEVRWEDARPPGEWEAHPPRDSGSTTTEGDRTEVTLTELDSGVPYRFSVRAVDGEGNESDSVAVEARTDPAPTDVGVADFDDESVTVGWTQPWVEGDEADLAEYAVELNGDVVKRVETDAASATVSLPESEDYHEVDVLGVDADGEETLARTGFVTVSDSGDGGPGVDAYFASKPVVRNDDAVNRANVTVEDGRVWIEGAMYYSTVGCTAVEVVSARFEDGVLRVSLGPTEVGGACMPGSGDVPYRAGFDLGDDPDHVVVEVGFSSTRAWQRDGLDGTLLVDSEDGNLDPGGTTDASLVLYGDSVEVGQYDVDLALDPAGVAEIEEIAAPDDVEGTTETSVAEDGTTASVAVEGTGGSLATGDGHVELATLSLTAASRGRTSVAVDSFSAATPAGEELDVGTVDADVVVDPLEAVAGDVPTDPDGDGLYEDVNGNGEGDLADAVDLYQHREAGAVTNHTSAYDFSGNDEVDLADVVQLFQENTD